MKALYKLIERVTRYYRKHKVVCELGSSDRSLKVFGRVVIENPSNVAIGKGCTLNEGVYISGHDFVVLGNHVSLSVGCKIITAYLEASLLQEKEKKDIHGSKPVKIGDNSQIGAGAIILPGVTVGSNVIVGAGAVVTKDIPSNSIAVGIPAQVVRK